MVETLQPDIRNMLSKIVGELLLFPSTAPLESVCIEILGELLRPQRSHRYLLVIDDVVNNLVNTVPIKSVSTGEVEKHFVDHWLFIYEPPTYLIADNGKQFKSKFFLDVRHILSIQNTFTTK